MCYWKQSRRGKRRTVYRLWFLGWARNTRFRRFLSDKRKFATMYHQHVKLVMVTDTSPKNPDDPCLRAAVLRNIPLSSGQCFVPRQCYCTLHTLTGLQPAFLRYPSSCGTIPHIQTNPQWKIRTRSTITSNLQPLLLLSAWLLWVPYLFLESLHQYHATILEAIFACTANEFTSFFTSDDIPAAPVVLKMIRRKTLYFLFICICPQRLLRTPLLCS